MLVITSVYKTSGEPVSLIVKGEIIVSAGAKSPEITELTAVVTAVETVDQCLQRVVECGIKNDYSFIILADHGNADYMINSDGSPNTAHTTNLVPCILIDKDYKHIDDGKLGDVAPTILKLMNISSPGIMTGDILVS